MNVSWRGSVDPLGAGLVNVHFVIWGCSHITSAAGGGGGGTANTDNC